MTTDTPNARDCEHGHLRRKCDECYMLKLAKEYVGWDATPEEALAAQHESIQRLRREVDRLKSQHEFDTRAKEDLRRTIAKLLAKQWTYE